MFRQISLATAKRMVSNQIICENQTAIYAYGLELVFSSFAGIIALVLVSLLGGKPFWWIPYLMGFIPIRLTGGGYHATSHRNCIVLFTAFYAIIISIFSFCIIPKEAWLVICTINVCVLFIFSPVEAKNKRLYEANRKKNRKRSLLLAIINLSVAVSLSIMQNSISSWLTLYFAGSTMADVSILLAVVINSFRKERES